VFLRHEQAALALALARRESRVAQRGMLKRVAAIVM
jgi:hypothetical protein